MDGQGGQKGSEVYVSRPCQPPAAFPLYLGGWEMGGRSPQEAASTPLETGGGPRDQRLLRALLSCWLGKPEGG